MSFFCFQSKTNVSNLICFQSTYYRICWVYFLCFQSTFFLMYVSNPLIICMLNRLISDFISRKSEKSKFSKIFYRGCSESKINSKDMLFNFRSCFSRQLWGRWHWPKSLLWLWVRHVYRSRCKNRLLAFGIFLLLINKIWFNFIFHIFYLIGTKGHFRCFREFKREFLKREFLKGDWEIEIEKHFFETQIKDCVN